MVAKKYYCVRKGKITGVFNNWEDCKASVDGCSGAEYKGVSTIEEAKEYLGELFCLRLQVDGEIGQGGSEAGQAVNGDITKGATEFPEKGYLLAYVDGSYDDFLKKYAFGCVFLLPDGRIFTMYGNGDNEKSLKHRNVTGEMLGAMYAVKFAMLNGFGGVELCYDYQGIEKWVTGEWRSRTELTSEYAAYMRKWGQQIQLRFTKVAAHTNVYYNELADKMAKTGLKKGNGVPKVCKIEDMEEYHGTDAIE